MSNDDVVFSAACSLPSPLLAPETMFDARTCTCPDPRFCRNSELPGRAAMVVHGMRGARSSHISIALASEAASSALRPKLANMTMDTKSVDRQNADDIEHVEQRPLEGFDAEDHGFVADVAQLPRGYFRSRFFVGSCAALAVSLVAGTASFAYPAPALGVINNDVGPDPSYPWISYVYNTAIAITFPLVGQLSDTFGRRYFFSGGAMLGIIGAVICSRANSISVLIGGNVFLGIASATQLSYHFVLGELVPTKYRYSAVAVLYFSTFPGSGFAPSITYALLQSHSSVGWRGCYYILIAAEVTAFLLWLCFYFPPNFHRKHGEVKKLQYVKSFDYVGAFLLTAGFVVFLFGISVGGTTYPWVSAAPISMIILGLLTLVAFGLWEALHKQPQPIAPPRIFTSIPWLAGAITLGFAASVYYTSAIVWPQQVATLYYPENLTKAGLLSNIPGLANISGQIIGGCSLHLLGSQKIQIVVTFFLGGVCSACKSVKLLCNPRADANG